MSMVRVLARSSQAKVHMKKTKWAWYTTKVDQKGYNISGIYVANDIAGYQFSSRKYPWHPKENRDSKEKGGLKSQNF